MSTGIDSTVRVLYRKTSMDHVKELTEAEDYNIHIQDEELRAEF